MKRRSFFKTLSGLPIIAAMNAENIPVCGDYSLPIPCDLTMGALSAALKTGVELKLGRPHTLLIGPENLFPARELLGGPPVDFAPFTREDFLVYSVTREIPIWSWKVLFEYGTVGSRGPR